MSQWVVVQSLCLDVSPGRLSSRVSSRSSGRRPSLPSPSRCLRVRSVHLVDVERTSCTHPEFLALFPTCIAPIIKSYSTQDPLLGGSVLLQWKDPTFTSRLTNLVSRSSPERTSSSPRPTLIPRGISPFDMSGSKGRFLSGENQNRGLPLPLFVPVADRQEAYWERPPNLS